MDTVFFSRVKIFVASLGLVLTLSACGNDQVASSVPEMSITPTPSTEPVDVTIKEKAPFFIPACDDLLPLAEIRDLLGSQLFESYNDNPEMLESPFGPKAADTLANAIQSQTCMWAFPNSDVIRKLVLAEISEESKVTLMAELDDSDFVKEVLDQTTTYVMNINEGVGMTNRWYSFQGNLWVTEFSDDATARVGHQAQIIMVAANPDWF